MATFFGPDLWQELERRGRGRGAKTLVVPYLSDDSRLRCSAGDLIITVATEATIAAGQTSAKVLVEASRRGATVLCLPGLHAKILRGDGYAVVSSANVSNSSPGLDEAGVALTARKDLDAVDRYIAELREKAVPVSGARLRELNRIPVTRGSSRRSGKPSILEALEHDLPVLGDVAFGWSHWGAELEESDVEAEAREHDFHVPEDWCHYESKIAAGVEERILTACRTRPYIEFPGKTTKDSELIGFSGSISSPRQLIGVFRFKSRLVSLFGAAGQVVPLNLKADKTALFLVLNRGLARAPKRLVNRLNHPAGLISRNDLRDLYCLGSRPGAA